MSDETVLVRLDKIEELADTLHCPYDNLECDCPVIGDACDFEEKRVCLLNWLRDRTPEGHTIKEEE